MTSPWCFNEESNIWWTSYYNDNNDDARSTSSSDDSDEYCHPDVEVGSCCSEHSDVVVHEFDSDDDSSYAYPLYERQEEEDDDCSDTDEEELEDAVEFTPVEIQLVDDSTSSTPTMELDSADPELDLTPSECLQHLHTAVGLCPPHSSREELSVFAWGAKAIVRVVNDAYVARGDPFEEGGIAHTAAVPAIRELDAIRRENADDFDDMCYQLNEALTYVWEQSQKLPGWSSRPVVELDSLPASSSAPASLEADGLACEAPFLPVVEPAGALGYDAGSNEHEETDEGVAVDAPSLKVRHRSEKRSVKQCLGVECVAQRTRSRSSRVLSKRTASVRVTRSMVRAGIAELVPGIGTEEVRKKPVVAKKIESSAGWVMASVPKANPSPSNKLGVSLTPPFLQKENK